MSQYIALMTHLMTCVNFLFLPFFLTFWGLLSQSALRGNFLTRGRDIQLGSPGLSEIHSVRTVPAASFCLHQHWEKIQLSVIFYFSFFFSISPGKRHTLPQDGPLFLHLVSPPFMERAHPPLGDRGGGRDGGRRGAREGTPKECRHGGWRNARQADIRGTRRMELR